MTEMCHEVRDAIALEGGAPDNEDFEKHVSECAECAQFLESVLAVEDQLDGLETPDVGDEVVEKLLARPELTAPRRSSTRYWVMGVAAAAAVAFVAARVTLMQPMLSPPEYAPSGVREGLLVGTGSGGGADVDGSTRKPESEEISEEELQQRLNSLGYVPGVAETVDRGAQSGADETFGYNVTEPSYNDLPADQLENDTTTQDKVTRREMWMNEQDVENKEILEARTRELNRGGFYRDLADGEPTVGDDGNKNEPAKKDAANAPRAQSPPPTPAAPPADAGRLYQEIPSRDDRQAQARAVGGAPDVDLDAVTATGEVSETEGVETENVTLGKARVALDAFRSRVVEDDELIGNSYLQRVAGPEKLVHVDAVYPEGAKQKRATGVVVIRVLIDRGGNVIRTIVVDSVEGLDQAAIDAVQQWKYAASEQEQRTVTVRIAFEAPEDPNNDARLFLEERERIDGLRFRDARGYWANTYLPGDPRTRFLAMRLGKAQHEHVAPHLDARPVAQPFDAPTRGALALSMHADRRGISGRERLLLQVGIQATESHGRRRPPMNVGIVLDGNGAEARAVVEALQQTRALGDRFRLIVPGKGEVVAPDSFRHGPLTVALDELDGSGDLAEAVGIAIERVHAGDDPTMPLGSSLVLVVTPRKLDGELETLSRLAHRSAVGGVPISVVGIGTDVDSEAIERLALSGQGRRYFLEQAADATSIIDRELAASSRVVARALRLRIKLADGVKLVDVIGSRNLSERQSQRVRDAEKSIDLRLSRNLGIEADRGEDEDGIQIVIPSFYAGDAHTILLDVVAERPGAIAEVTARYKDLAELRNTVAKASLSLPRLQTSAGPLETNVVKNYLAFRLSQELDAAADELDRGDRAAAVARLDRARRLLTGLGLEGDREVARDVAMLSDYTGILTSSAEPALIAYIADSLRFAGVSKTRLPAALT